nr:hypothetical protein [uncultured Catonella sp.]
MKNLRLDIGKELGMGLFHKKEKNNAKIEIKEDYENEVRTICETIDNAKLQIKIIRKEYDEVNRFLQDAQIIDGLPVEPKEELVDIAKHLLVLRKDILNLKRKRTELTEFEFGIMEKYEDVLPEEIKRLKKEEEYELVIKSDLRKLAGEKAVLKHEEEVELGKKLFLNKLGIVSGIVIGLLLVMYLILYMLFDTFADTAFLLTIIGGIFIAFYIFLETDKNSKALKLNASKENKLISLTNTVKIKYVNQKASLDFSHDKYAVNNVLELEYRYNQYMAYIEDEIKRKKASSTYEFYNNKYKEILNEYRIHDTEVWSYQADAVVDHKEMVEIRHKLNERRQSIREKLEQNANVITELGVRLTEIGEKSPELSVMVNGMMELYGIGAA